MPLGEHPHRKPAAPDLGGDLLYGADRVPGVRAVKEDVARKVVDEAEERHPEQALLPDRDHALPHALRLEDNVPVALVDAGVNAGFDVLHQLLTLNMDLEAHDRGREREQAVRHDIGVLRMPRPEDADDEADY